MKKKLDSPLVFIFPGLIGLFIFYIWPFFILIKCSLFSSLNNANFIGLQNYVELLNNEVFIKSVDNTFSILIVSIVLNMTISLFIAVLINKRSLRDVFILIILLPLAIPSGSMVLFWHSFFDKYGFLNSYIENPINWFESDWTRAIVVIIFLWKNIGYNVLLYISGLSSIKKEYYEMARIEGAGVFSSFFRVTLVYLAPTFVLTLIMSIVNSFKIFKEIYLITGKYPHDSIFTIQHYMTNLFNNLNYSKLSASTVILVLTIAVIIQALLKIARSFHESLINTKKYIYCHLSEKSMP